MQSTTSAGVAEKTFFRASENVVFSGHGSRITVRKNPGYLAGWLAGYLAIWLATRWLASSLTIGFVAACLAILAINYLAGWLIGRSALAIWLAL